MNATPRLYLVPTPIGNLEDITLRALRTLREVDVVLAEDTRTTGLLLQHLDIRKPLRSFHAHNEHRTVAGWVDQMAGGQTVALVSDAGTPGISDPGYLLVRGCVARGVGVVVLPGATAFVPALVGSALPCDRFVFEGFLPVKKGRATRLRALAQESRTVVLYESPHRLRRTLGDLVATLGSHRPAAVCRELTKLYEETCRGTLQELQQHFDAHEPRGEFVVVVQGADEATKTD